MIKIISLFRITAALIVSLVLPAFADHDDGDFTFEYSYVLKFSRSELAQHYSFIEITDSPHDQRFEVVDLYRAEDETDPYKEIRLSFNGDIPTTLWSIPNRDTQEKIETWLTENVEALDVYDESSAKEVWVSDKSIAAFRKAFGKDLIKFSYRPSVVLGQMLKLSQCGIHFHKPKSAKLTKVSESVKLVAKGNIGSIVPFNFTFEYDGVGGKSLTSEQAEKLEVSDFKNLLNEGADTNEIRSYEAEVERWHKNREHSYSDYSIGESWSEDWGSYLWFFAAPLVPCVMLITIYRKGKKRALRLP